MIPRRQGSRAHVPLVAPLVHSADTGVAEEAMRFLVRDAERADLSRDTLLEWLADEGEFGFKPLDAVQLVGEAYLQLHDERPLREILRLLDHEYADPTGAAAADSLVTALTPDYRSMMPRDPHLLSRRADIAAYRRRAEAMLREAPRSAVKPAPTRHARRAARDGAHVPDWNGSEAQTQTSCPAKCAPATISPEASPGSSTC